MKWLFLLPVLAALLLTSSAKRGFILTGPKLYDVGENETLVLHLFDIKESGSVKIRMVNLTGDEVYSEVTVPIENGQTTSVQFPLPSKLPKGLYKAKLEVDGLIGDYRINKSLEVNLRTRGSIVFINTDKPLYKAGQTVKLRVLITDTNLRPHKPPKVGQIWITDPNGIRIAQWSNVSFSGGLIHKEILLPEEPVLGPWYIKVKINDNIYSKIFKVEEYVLPTFEVKITPPTYFLTNAKNATWEVCAIYTYGKPVKGELYTKLYQSPSYWVEERNYIENRTEIKGCTKITLLMEQLINSPAFHLYSNLQLYAEVTEEGTGMKMNSTSTTRPTNVPYTISGIDGLHPRYFRSGIPLRVTMDVKAPDSKPILDELIKVCLDVMRKEWSDISTVTNAVKVCKNYTSNEDGNIFFTIPPQNPNTVSLSVEVEPAVWETAAIGAFALQKPHRSFTLSPWFSASGSHIQLERIQNIDCRAFSPDIEVTIPFHIAHSETGIKKMHYQILSRGDIVRHGDFDVRLEPDGDKNATDGTYLPDHPTAICADNSVQWDSELKPAKYLTQNYLSFKLDDKMTPRVRILLYMVTDNGDIIADSVSYDTDACFANKVEMRFGEEKLSPGDKATIHLTAEPQSLCSVGVVDKNVYLLHEADLLTGSQITSRLLPLDTHSYTYPDQRTDDYTYCTRKKPGYKPAGYLDAISAFADNGGIVLSDLPLETRPCQRADSGVCYSRPVVVDSYQTKAYAYLTTEALLVYTTSPQPPRSPPPPATTVRTDFPDTWLFKLYKVSDKGSLEVKQQMPDSITEWQGEAICIHPDKGLGISKPATVVAFQPFFASLTLPYSVVRNEIVPITVTVFNYLKVCTPIKVYIKETERFLLYNGTFTKSLCVCGDDSSTIYFHIRPGKIGIMNITATAETTEDQDVCGNFDTSLVVKRRDTLTKPVLVEAEGFMKEETFNSYFCLSEEEDRTFKTEHLLNLPEASVLVPDSARAYTSVSGDLMGPTLEGLERLVRMPTGCGEQNMIGLVPNIVVLDYLNATNKLKEDVRQKAVGHIRQGYIRQQKYRHPDGSYSTFGQNDKEGSIWLTAFVVRTFASARRYITIDEGSLETSRKWILSRQRENGCFPMVGTVHNKAMKGGVSKEDETTSTLTAYIIISMLESGKMDKEAVAKGFRCIEAKSKPTNYSKSLFSYAAAVTKYNSSKYLELLISTAEKDGGFLYWEESDKSIAVETASYAILTLLESGRKEDFLEVPSIAKWLAKQRNSYGGFYSTQDTVMALQALGKYGSIITRESPKMGILVRTDKIDEMFQVSPENELLMQRTSLKLEDDPETSVEIVASGTGCALVQTSLRYNIVVPAPSKDFELSVQTQRKPGGGCSDVEIRICASYNHPDGSNMAIIEVKMVTGYSPLIHTVKELLQLKHLEIRRYEFKEDTNTLYLYIETLTQNSSCFSFEVTQEIKVLDVKPSSIKVYDYYDEGKSLSVPYLIEETCTE